VKVLFVASEAAPLVKVGGLADVVGSLPKALGSLGHDVRVALPGYGTAIDWPRWKPQWQTRINVPRQWGDQPAEIWETWVGNIRHYLVTGAPIPGQGPVYGSGIQEDAPKFIFFSLAALWATQALGWTPDVVHGHDFHSGAALWWLATEGRGNESFRDVASVLTIHNLPYAGQGAGKFLGDYRLPLTDALRALPPAFDDSMLGLGILGADYLSTVSPTYAREILTPAGGRGLDGVLRARADHLAGILNGIDTDFWNPATDRILARRFDLATLALRAENKRALQQDAGLAPEAHTPLLAVVSRLDSQKGFDVAAPVVRRWLELGGEFVLLGTGDADVERAMASLEAAFPGRASVRLRFDAAYAHRIYAGADALLIPSRYEPCGLTQMIAMRYGAVPIARRTGGLADTVVDAGDPGGNGILFDELSPPSVADALERAVRVYAQAARWAELQRRGMQSDFSWTRSAAAYSDLYELARSSRQEQ
jgi:starch synthase